MKNLRIEIWRFIFAVYILCYHTLGHVYRIPTGGYIGVDVFAVVGGYFLAASYWRATQRNEEAGGSIQYAGKRFWRLWPMCAASFVINLILRWLRAKWTLAKAADVLYKSFPEGLMLSIRVTVNGVAWFLAAMFLVGILIWSVLSMDKRRKWAVGLLFVAATMIYAVFIEKAGRIHFHTSREMLLIGHDGFWRIFADMAMGVVAFAAFQRIETLKSKRFCRIMHIAGNLFMAGLLALSFFRYNEIADFWCIFFAWCGVICLSMQKENQVPKSNVESRLWKFISFLGRLAFPVFLLHEGVYGFLVTYPITSSPALGCLCVLAATCMIAIPMEYMVDFVVRKAQKHLAKAFEAKERPAE